MRSTFLSSLKARWRRNRQCAEISVFDPIFHPPLILREAYFRGLKGAHPRGPSLGPGPWASNIPLQVEAKKQFRNIYEHLQYNRGHSNKL